MRPAVVTAVLLLVCILDTVTADDSVQDIIDACEENYLKTPCGDGWISINAFICAKYIREEKTFDEAQEHCSSLESQLIAVHNNDDMWNLVCMSVEINPNSNKIWAAVQRQGGDYKYLDGSDLEYPGWVDDEPKPDEGEDCVESRLEKWGEWNDVPCSEKRPFVCMTTV